MFGLSRLLTLIVLLLGGLTSCFLLYGYCRDRYWYRGYPYVARAEFSLKPWAKAFATVDSTIPEWGSVFADQLYADYCTYCYKEARDKDPVRREHSVLASAGFQWLQVSFEADSEEEAATLLQKVMEEDLDRLSAIYEKRYQTARNRYLKTHPQEAGNIREHLPSYWSGKMEVGRREKPGSWILKSDYQKTHREGDILVVPKN